MSGAAANAAVVAHNEELKQYVTMLTDVLKEASEEITALKARVAASEADAQEAQRQLHERLREDVDLHARLAHLQAVAGEAGLSTEAVAISVDTATPLAGAGGGGAGEGGDAGAAAFVTPLAGDGSASGTAAAGSTKAVSQEVQALRDNYHQALMTNEALRADIEELQQTVAALEDKVASAPVSTKARSRSVTGLHPLQESLEEAAGAVDASPLEKITFEVHEFERSFPLGGWSSQLLPTDPYVVHGSACGCRRSRRVHSEGRRPPTTHSPPPAVPCFVLAFWVCHVCVVRLRCSWRSHLRPNFSDASGSEPLPKEDVALPGADWYWLDEWDIDTSGVRTLYIVAEFSLSFALCGLTCGMFACNTSGHGFFLCVHQSRGPVDEGGWTYGDKFSTLLRGGGSECVLACCLGTNDVQPRPLGLGIVI